MSDFTKCSMLSNTFRFGLLLLYQSMLNLVRKISGQSESQEETEQFLEKLKTEAHESVKSNALEEPETL